MGVPLARTRHQACRPSLLIVPGLFVDREEQLECVQKEMTGAAGRVEHLEVARIFFGAWRQRLRVSDEALDSVRGLIQGEYGDRYLPDFWLPDIDTWFEVKGQEPHYEIDSKMRRFPAKR